MFPPLLGGRYGSFKNVRYSETFTGPISLGSFAFNWSCGSSGMLISTFNRGRVSGEIFLPDTGRPPRPCGHRIVAA